MFKLKNILQLSALMFFVMSCDDYLETPPADLMTSDGFYQTPSQSEQGVVGIYSDLRELANSEYLLMSECRSDNAWTEPRPNGLRDFSEISTFRATSDLATFNSVWNTWYKVIYDANTAIAKIAGCNFESNDKIKKQFMGEVYFLRGWAYFELSRLFGNVPIIDAPLSPSEVKKVPQSSAREVLDNIVVPDLINAQTMLPLKENMVSANGTSIVLQGRADKMAAEAMLARMYMTLAGFPYYDSDAKILAKKQLEIVLNYSKSNQNKYWAPTLDEWRKQWMPSTDYYNKYSIFAIQYRTGGTGNSALFNFSMALPPSYTNRRIFGNEIYVEKSLMYEFDKIYSDGKKDGRGNGFSVLTGYEAEPNYPAYTNTKEKLILEDGSQVDVYTKSMFYKFMPSKRKIAELGMSLTPEVTMKDDNDWPVNLPILRLEDMMLMYAELLVEEGKIMEAVAYVNDIRKRAGCDEVNTVSAADALKLIKRERRIELMGEGVRWFDLVRWGEWQTEIQSLFDSYHNPDGTDKNNVKTGRYLYPIPLNQLNVTPGLYKQNEGY